MGESIVCVCVCVCGGGGGGQLRSQDELFVKSLFGLTVCVFYSSSFSHLVF